jgi:predicted permease
MPIARDFADDVRFGLRGLRRHPGFAALVVLSLALGIAANAAIFSVLSALLLRPLPVPEPERLTFLSDGLGSGRSTRITLREGVLRSFSYPLYQRLASDPSFAGLAAEDSKLAVARVARAGDAQRTSAANGQPVSGNYFAVMGVSAFRGRTLAPVDETSPGADPVLVLSHGFWQSRFAADPGVVGSQLLVNGRSYTAIGVAAPDFTGSKVGQAVDFWVPLTMHGDLHGHSPLLAVRRMWWLNVVGRLAPSVSLEAAQASLTLGLRRFLGELAGELRASERADLANNQIRIQLHSGATGVSRLRQDFGHSLLVLQAGVGLLLLIVCLNVSHLLLARAVNRQREMSIRAALGASRARLARQLLAEGLLLAALGLLAAVLATRWLIDGLLALALSEQAGRALAVGPDRRVWLFTVGLALASALVLGLVPAWQAARADRQATPAGTSLAVTPGGRRRLASRLLLASQVAFSLVLLAGAGLLSGSLRKLRDVDKGFDQEHVLLVELDPRFVPAAERESAAFQDRLLGRIAALPGVQSASLSHNEILRAGRWNTMLSFAGAAASIQPVPHLFVVSARYFETVGMTLVGGRPFVAADREGAPQVAIVNETLARRVGPAQQVLGRRLRLGDVDSGEPADIEVVGIVRDARIDDLREPPRPTLYRPLAQVPDEGADAIQVRVLGDPAALADRLRREIQQVHPALHVVGTQTMTAAVEQSLRRERVLATLSSAFGLAALFLVCLGLYGVIAQWAAQRTREIGVRMALGATAVGVRWLVLRQALALVLAGVALGVPAALAAGRGIESLLYGVTSADPANLALATATLVAVATLAAYLPARRASRADPVMALRCE